MNESSYQHNRAKGPPRVHDAGGPAAVTAPAEATDNPVAFLVRDSASWFKLPSWPGHRPYYYDSQMRIASVNNITAQYGGQNVLNGVSFEISAGEKLGLIGPNG